MPLKIRAHIVIDGNNDSDEKEWQPRDWNEQWDNLKEMRKAFDAPVDTLGCERLADKNESLPIYRYQVLLSLMLSSQTKDEVTSAAIKKLQKHGCNVDNILKTDDEDLEQLVYPVGFYKTKAKHIKKTSQILKDKFSGDVPNTFKELCSLPGVGPKMAHLVMKCAWNEVTGIAVDSHVHKICYRLGWTKKVTKNPIDTEKAIEKWIPKSLWPEVNYIMVGFGQQTCLTQRPKCESCLNKNTCLYNLGYRK